MYFKNSIPIILFVFSLISASCERFLDVQPKEATSDENTIIDENSAKAAVRGLYHQLGSDGYYGYSFQTLGFFSGNDIDYVGSQIFNKQLMNHDVKADLSALSISWEAIYNAINRANNIIAKVPELVLTSTFTETDRNGLLGEAYFVRALSYFDLVRTWGGVQLILTPTASAADWPEVKRSSAADTYQQVLLDLKTAEPLLPDEVNRIRATRKTVWALRARLHLYLEQWEDAENYATKIIEDQSNYELISPYSAFFDGETSATKESILELYYNINTLNLQAYQWQPTTKGGVGWVKPSLQIVDLLNDPETGGNRAELLLPVVVNGVQDWYGNLYHRLRGSGGTDPAFLIRVAELYLIRAEARVEKNDPDIEGAIADLDAVRSRAGLQGTEATTKEELLLAIEKENRVEFALEDHRWYDLCRTGRATEVLGIHDPNKLLLPIPYSETTIDENLDPN